MRCGAASLRRAPARRSCGPAGPRVAVEQDRDLVARRVLELLHHQLPAARGRRPVHLAAATRPPRTRARCAARSPSGAGAAAGAVARAWRRFGEEPLELDEPRVDEQRACVRQRHAACSSAERVLDRARSPLERVAAARHRRAARSAAQEPAVAVAARSGARRAARTARRRPTPAPSGARAARARASTRPDVVALDVLAESARRRLTRIGRAGGGTPAPTTSDREQRARPRPGTARASRSAHAATYRRARRARAAARPAPVSIRPGRASSRARRGRVVGADARPRAPRARRSAGARARARRPPSRRRARR